MFHLEKVKEPVFVLRGNHSTEEFNFGDAYTFICVIRHTSPTSCYIGPALGKIDRLQVKKVLNHLKQMGYETIEWERAKDVA